MEIVIALLVIIILILLFGRENFLVMIGGTFKGIGWLLRWVAVLITIVVILAVIWVVISELFSFFSS